VIILDASAVIEFLMRAEKVPVLSDALEKTDQIACPVILDLEVLNVLRRQVQEKVVTLPRSEEALELYGQLPLVRYPTSLVAEKIWALRNNFTSYDASYIALAEVLDVPIYTKDQKWKGKRGHGAEIHFI
jgi:predicted nucleic acid-binding protein